MENFSFVENSRKYKPIVLVMAILGYVGFITFLCLFILGKTGNTEHPDIKYITPSRIIITLVIAVYCTWAYFSKHLKYYMKISADKIEFFSNNKNESFLVSDFKGYNIVKKASWLMGGYWTYELNFNGKLFVINSFKGKELEFELSKIQNSNLQKKEAD